VSRRDNTGTKTSAGLLAWMIHKNSMNGRSDRQLTRHVPEGIVVPLRSHLSA
jgi:hypothetical protein